MELPLHPTENLTGNTELKKQIQKGTQCMKPFTQSLNQTKVNYSVKKSAGGDGNDLKEAGGGFWVYENSPSSSPICTFPDVLLQSLLKYISDKLLKNKGNTVLPTVTMASKPYSGTGRTRVFTGCHETSEATARLGCLASGHCRFTGRGPTGQKTQRLSRALWSWLLTPHHYSKVLKCTSIKIK